jgi:2,3-dihydroxybiphenyl 1,2-dioxygenase
MGVTQLGYVGVYVSDLSRWEGFVREVLGMQVMERGEDGTLYVRMDEYHHRIVLHPGEQDDLAYVGWQVATESALEEVRRRLEGAGVKVSRGTSAEVESRKVAALYKFEDPDGHPSEIFCGPLIAEEPFMPGRPIQGFRTGPLGMGHVVVRSQDPERTRAFYCELLGFRVSDYIDISQQLQLPPEEGLLIFLHCNGRHHSIALGRFPFPKRLHHIMVELESLDDVGRAYDICQRREIPIGMSLGKHTNDHMISFYMQTPSGFYIEYGWGGRVVDDTHWQVTTYRSGSFWGHHLVHRPFIEQREG